MIKARIRTSSVILALLVLSLCACQSNQNERWELVPATIILDMASTPVPASIASSVSSVVVPAQGVVDQPTLIAVTSFGGGCNLQGTTTTELGDHVARIRVFDKQRVTDGEMVCTTELKRFLHQTSLVLPVAGIWRIEIIGVHKGKGLDRQTTIKRSLTIQ